MMMMMMMMTMVMLLLLKTKLQNHAHASSRMIETQAQTCSKWFRILFQGEQVPPAVLCSLHLFNDTRGEWGGVREILRFSQAI